MLEVVEMALVEGRGVPWGVSVPEGGWGGDDGLLGKGNRDFSFFLRRGSLNRVVVVEMVWVVVVVA
jgi:hypothetical protein